MLSIKVCKFKYVLHSFKNDIYFIYKQLTSCPAKPPYVHNNKTMEKKSCGKQ